MSETSASMHRPQRTPGTHHDQKHAAATCVFPKTVLLNGKRNSRCSLGLVWIGRGWKGYFSLDILEGMVFEAETCLYFKLYGH